MIVLDAATGDELRELLDGVPVEDPAGNALALDPDGTEAFVAVPAADPGGDPEILRVPLGGGEPAVVAQGTTPAVSPEGDTLAYVALEAGDEGPLPDPVLVLRDLERGEERRLTREEPFYHIPDVAWTADGTRVAFTAGEIYTGVHVVDRDAASLDDARGLGPDNEPASERSWGPIAALGPAGLVVVETCCDVPREERWHLTAVDVADGTTTDGGLPDERLEATDLDSDAAAERLLLVVGAGPEGGQLLRWDGAGDPEPVAEDIITAAW